MAGLKCGVTGSSSNPFGADNTACCMGITMLKMLL